ncbi:MAG: metal ABC transporter solute-binding protein, Zn/Mn family [Oligosphaeraceae bacterium]
MRGRLTLLACLLSACLLGAEPLRVFVSIVPQLECVRRLAGDWVEAEALVPPGASPETYAPGPRQMSALGRSRLLVLIGVPFERALVRKVRGAFPRVELLDATPGMAFRVMQADEASAHAHHGEGETDGEEDDEDEDEHGGAHHECHGHGEGEHDPHVWLSPLNMAVHARHVARALGRLLPSRAADIDARLAAYCAELETLDAELRRSLAVRPVRDVVVFHPAFGYLLERCGLRQRVIELGGREPTGRHLGTVIRWARRRHVDRIYVQPQFSVSSASVIASEIGGKVMVLDPMPHPYLAGMRRLARQLLQ